MSREIFPNDARDSRGPEVRSALNVTSFFGGKDKGSCLQFTPGDRMAGYGVLERHDVATLVEALADWLDETAPAVDQHITREKK